MWVFGITRCQDHSYAAVFLDYYRLAAGPDGTIGEYSADVKHNAELALRLSRMIHDYVECLTKASKLSEADVLPRFPLLQPFQEKQATQVSSPAVVSGSRLADESVHILLLPFLTGRSFLPRP